MKNKIYKVNFRRKREGKTNYKKRLKMLMSDSPRLVIRNSLRGTQASIVTYNQKGDRVLSSANSKELRKLGLKIDEGNLPSAYLVGLLLGKKATSKNIKKAILDLGLNKSVKGSRIYAALSGALDAGLNVPCNKKILPPKDRISGGHIAKYAASLEKDKNAFNKQFNNYIRNNINPKNIAEHFNEIKNKILSA